jgi:RHS repeat-associated protein
VANIAVITQDGCSWTATTNDSFITIDPPSGTGSGTISYAITANTSNTPRTGTITIAGQTYTVTQDPACTPPPPNLVSWWPAEDTANDIKGANNGTLQGGVSFITGKVGKAFHFNGTDGAVVINDSDTIKPANITVEAWVRFDALDTPGASAPGLQYIVFKKNSRSSPFEGYSLYKYRPGATDHLNFTISSAAGTQIVATSTTVVTAGQFYHVAGTYDGSSVKLYVNGALENQQPASFPLDYDTRPLFFGTSGESSFDGKLKGLLDEVSIYDRALAAAEIASIHDAGSGGKCKELDFADVPPSNQFYEYIRRLSALGITVGCGGGNYCPSQPVTREQMAAFIIRALGDFNPPTPAQQRFADVPPSNVFYPFIEQMAQLGITVGCGGGNYCPGQPVTREQMAAFIIRALGVPSPPPPAQQRFADVPPSNQFYPFIEQMAIRRITVGCGGNNYCPSDPVTREQMAAFLIRAFDTQINYPPAVFAGTDQTVTLPSTSSLTGFVSDDGLPGCGLLTFGWSQVSGPGTVTFDTPNSLTTTASFSAPGTYVLRLTANDGQLTSVSDVTVTVNPVNPNNQAPQVNAGSNQTITLPGTATLNGTVTDDGQPVGSTLTISWTQVSGPATVLFSNASAATGTATFSTQGSYVVRLTANDSELSSSSDVTITVNADSTPPPPDPVMIASPIDPTVSTTIGAATQFLYTSPNPIQTGVAPGTISMVRAAVMRGRVVDHNGSAVPLVKISVLNHPELGQTLSRADGKFDMAVNGGGLLTVKYEKVGLMPLERQMDVPWQDYSMTPDVMMGTYDPNVTFIDLNASIPIQVAQGTTMSDTDGTRRATLLFQQGTTATITLSNGTTQPISTLHVRATEYTVGPSGPRAMPGELPPTSGYTNAIEFSADEAVAVGATQVGFSQPVIEYLDNFLEFPVGIDVPSGYYDQTSSRWIPSSNGRVVKVLTISNEQVNLDIDGSGLPANDPAYAALGITTAERQQLATLYSAGRSLWRVRLNHFSSWDSNWGFGPPPDAQPPNLPPPQTNNPCDCEHQKKGSIIGVERQTLGETINITGTPFFFSYSSERQAGHNAAAIPLSGASLPSSLKRIDLTVQVGGSTILSQSFPATTNQQTSLTWDGKDVYGRTVQGAQPATFAVGYVYDGVYEQTQRFGYNGNGTIIVGDRTRREVSLQQQTTSPLGHFDARALGLGGWSLNINHFYDFYGATLYLGDGTRRTVANINAVISTVVDGSDASINPAFCAVGPDGSFFVVDGNTLIKKFDRSGAVTTVAGTHTCAFSGDGGPATQAGICANNISVGKDGSIYFYNFVGARIRKIDPAGIITTVAGNGGQGSSGDGGPATQAQIGPVTSRPRIAPDGSFYFVDHASEHVRRVGPDGIITTVADGGTDIALGPDGSLYVVGNGVISRMTPDGVVRTVAGGGAFGNGDADGTPATSADLRLGNDRVEVAPDGVFYFTETDGFGSGLATVRRVGLDGYLSTVAGNRVAGFSGDGGPAAAAQLSQSINSLNLGPDGSLYLSDFGNSRVRRVAQPLPGYTASVFLIPSEEGNQVYQFDSNGKHLSTVNALTGATVYSFTYDGAGLLTQVTDGDGNITTIQRDGSGNPTGILSPYNQLTSLTLDANGYLSAITDPASQSYQFSSTSVGLITGETDPRGNSHSFLYDAIGRLVKDTDPATGMQALVRTDQGQDYSVAFSTALNRTSNYQVQLLPSNDLNQIETEPSGLETLFIQRKNGVDNLLSPDGVIRTQTVGGDPRFGINAPILTGDLIQTPGGLNLNLDSTRSVTLTDPNNPLSLSTQTDTLDINAQTYTSVFDAPTRTFNASTPLNRQATAVIDLQGRATQFQFANFNASNYAYDSHGRLGTSTAGAGAEARTFTYTYNAAGLLASSTDPLSQVTSFTYDNAGRVTQRTLPDTRVIGYGYDANGNVTSITPPGRPAHAFAYNAVNLLTSYTPPTVGGTGATQLAYNLDRQLTTITRPDALTLNFAYDSAGRLQTLTVPSGAYTYGYNSTTGNLASIAAPGSNSLTYTYDGFLLTNTTWTGPVAGSVSRVFDDNFRVTSQSVNGGNSVAFSYDNDSLLTAAGSLALTRHAQNGLITGTTLGNVTDTRGDNNFGEPASYSASFNATGLYSATYTRDKLGRITQKVETIGGMPDTYDYTYDTAGRLTQVKLNTATISTYAYDGNSNRASLTTSGGTVTGTYDNQDRLTAYGTATYAYTPNGEVQSKTDGAQTTQYNYDVLGNLKSVTLPGGALINYVIDGQNRRVGKKVNGTLSQGFLYQNQLAPVAELDGNNSIVSRFVYGSRRNVPDYMIKGGVTYRIISDSLGSPRLVVDVTTGTVAQEIDYDEFGVVMMDTSPGFQPFGFAGGLYDSDTGLVRFGVRDYDAQTGRWTAKDPILFDGQDTNLYGYVLDDPVNFIDQDGRDTTLADVLKVLNDLIDGLRQSDPNFDKAIKDNQDQQQQNNQQDNSGQQQNQQNTGQQQKPDDPPKGPDPDKKKFPVLCKFRPRNRT